METIIQNLNILGKYYIERKAELVYPILHKQVFFYDNVFSDTRLRGRHNFIKFFETVILNHAAFSIARIDYNVYPIRYSNKYLISITKTGRDIHPIYLIIEFKNELVKAIYEVYEIFAHTPYSYLRRIIKNVSIEKISVFQPEKLSRLQGKFLKERGNLMILNINHLEEKTCITYVFQPPLSLANGGWIRVPNMNHIRTSAVEESKYRSTAMVNYDGAEVYFNNCDECLIYKVYYFPISMYFTSLEILEESGDKTPERFDFEYNDLL